MHGRLDTFKNKYCTINECLPLVRHINLVSEAYEPVSMRVNFIAPESFKVDLVDKVKRDWAGGYWVSRR